MKTLFLAIALSLSISTAFSNEIVSVQLNDNSSIHAQEISAIHVSADKKIDFIELHEGSRVESSEIKNVVYKTTAFFRPGTPISVFKSGDVSTH